MSRYFLQSMYLGISAMYRVCPSITPCYARGHSPCHGLKCICWCQSRVRLSSADLQHEWILTACLIMAVAAVLSPLLLLFGLKYGTIETLRFRLVQDPRNREIRPLVSKSFAKAWIEDIRRRADVAFITPMTRQIAATITVLVKERPEKKVDLDIVPTGAGDALVLENHAPIPQRGECVLTHVAAEELKVRPGETLVATATR